MLSFTLNKQALKDLQAVKVGLSKERYLILSNYHCKIDSYFDGKSYLQATVSNEKFYIETVVETVNNVNFKTTFLTPADFFDINIKTNANFTIDTDNQKAIIETDNFKTTNKIMDSNGYPVFGKEINNLIGEIKSDNLLQLLQVKTATSKEEQYKAFNGVLFDIKDGVFNAVATDRARLHWFAIEGNFKDFYGIINLETANILAKLLTKYKNKDVYIFSNDGYISFLFDNTKVITQLIDDKFPQYQAVLLENGNNVNSIILNKTQLINAISGLITKETIAINLKFTNTKMMLYTDNAEANIDYQNNTNNDITNYQLTINGKYTIDFLKTLPNDIDNITFYFKEPVKPLEMRANNYILIMTPIRDTYK
jgi:DNA polymerase-3 subunit beta